MGKAELPLHAPGTKTDKGYIGQSVPRPNAQRLLQGRGAFTDDLRFPRLAHVAFLRSPYAHAKIRKLDFAKALKSPGVIGVFDGRAVAEYCTPLGRGARAPEGHQVPAAARHRHRAGLLAGRGLRGGGRGVPQAGRGRRGPDRGRVARAARGRGHGSGARREVRHPPGARRQRLLQARARHRRRGRSLRQSRRGGGGDLRFRAAHGRMQRGPRDRRRLQRRRALAHRVPRDAGAAHDAGHLLAAPRHPRGERARDRQGRGRLLRHQGARLSRRDGHGGALGDAAPPGEVRRRPPGVLSLRHPRARAQGEGAPRLHQGGRDSRLRSRRPDGHRALLGVPAHQRHRGQPGGQPDGRPVQAPEVPREAERGVHQQERHLPVPCGRPPDRGGADGGHRRPRRPRAEDGPGGIPQEEPDPRRRLSLHLSLRASSSSSSRTTRRCRSSSTP